MFRDPDKVSPGGIPTLNKVQHSIRDHYLHYLSYTPQYLLYCTFLLFLLSTFVLILQNTRAISPSYLPSSPFQFGDPPPNSAARIEPWLTISSGLACLAKDATYYVR